MAINRLGVVLLFLLLSLSIQAQITINSIIANKTTGCAPENGITLTYDATGNIENISWDFGNGQSNVGNSTVSPTYTTPGTYTVTLVLSNSAGDSDTETLTINIFEKPTANFSATDTSGCVPLAVDFTDLSTSNGGNIVSWEWTFNDGTTNKPTIPNPPHTFTIEGSFPVVLVVVDDNGCADDTTITFNTSTPAVADFTANPTFSCTAPVTVSFTDNSTSNYPLTYNWDFGDGNTSSDTNPVNTYNAYGSYTVNLTVTQSTGCQTTITKPGFINITPTVAAFTMNDDSICSGDLAVFNGSSSQVANQFSWNFGDGSGFTAPSSSAGTSYNYSAPGIYTVTLVVSYNGSCYDTTTSSILVDDVTADFSLLNSYYSCSTPYTVSFTGATSSSTYTSITDYSWDFGDGNTGAGVAPSNNYTASGIYDVQITVTNESGCSDVKTINQAVIINQISPSINITSIPPVGERCINMDVTFNNNTATGTVVNDPIISVTWDFADGVNTGAGAPSSSVSATNTTGTYNTLTHTYVDHGDYTVVLTVETDSGCISTTNILVEVGAKPQADFIVTPTDLCASASVTFTDNSTDYDGNAYGAAGYLNDFWQWSNLNGNFQFGGSQDVNIFQMAKDTGWMDVRFIVGYNSCYDTIDSAKVVFFRGPVVKNIAKSPVDCSKPYERTYTAEYIDTTSYFWIFGDGDTLKCYGNTGTIPAGTHGGRTSGTCSNPTHVYQTTGDYVVELLAWNRNNYPFDTDSCMYAADPITVKIRDIYASFFINGITNQDTICLNSQVTLDATGSSDGSTGNNEVQYQWQFGDGISTSFGSGTGVIGGVTGTSGTYSQPTHTYSVLGAFQITLTTSDIHGCTDNDYATVSVFRPSAHIDLTSGVVAGCVPFDVTFTDASTYDPLAPIVAWGWQDNTGLINEPLSSLTPTTVSAHYITPGTKSIVLTVMDKFGCQDDTLYNVDVVRPTPNFSVIDNQLCAIVDSAEFTDLSSPYSSSLGTYPLVDWQWDFGDGNTISGVQNPLHPYTSGGTYTVALTVTDNLGCDSSIVISNIVDVQDIPQAGFKVDQTVFDCYPATVMFIDTSISNNIVNWTWDVGVPASLVNNDTILFTYTQPDTFDVQLIVETSYGCKDTVMQPQYIRVDGPTAEFSVSTDTICINNTVTFSITDSSNVLGFSWNFGDATSIDNVNPVSHQYVFLPPLGGNSFNATLFFWSDTNQICKKSVDTTIYIHNVQADFTLNGLDSAYGCMPLTVNINDASVGASSYAWDFGNGNTATSGTSFTELYDNPGIYTVTLAISNTQFGCFDTTSKKVEVYPAPDITLTKDTKICEGDSVILTASGGATYQWMPGTWLNRTDSSTVVSFPEDTILYYVTVTDVNGCSSKDSVNIQVIGNPYYTISNTDTLFVNEKDTIYVSVSPGFTYEWQPITYLSCASCDTTIFTAEEPGEYTYTLFIYDDGQTCPPTEGEITIYVSDDKRIDIPNAFSPNGDGLNDVLYVKGHGIEQLLEFKVYNRWGQLIYENPGDINQGWDGTYKGVPQNMDTYIVVVKAKFYNGTEGYAKNKAGEIRHHVTLLR